MLVALAAIAFAALTLAASLSVLRWAFRQLERKDRLHEQRVTELLDRVMHVINKPWNPSPQAREQGEAEDLRQAARSRLFEGIVEDAEYAPAPIMDPVPYAPTFEEPLPAMVADVPLEQIT